MKPTRELRTADLEREAIEAARKQPPAEKLLEGLRLFDRTCRIMADGIRAQNPTADLPSILETLRARLRLARDLETR